jgi:O-antigen/teichoic acid export membrane protein
MRHIVTIHSALVIIAATSVIGALALLKGGQVHFVINRHIQMKHMIGNFSFSKWLFASSLLQWSASNLFVIAVAAVLGPAGAGMLRLGQSAMGVLHIWFQGMENFVPAHAAALVFAAGPQVMREYLLRTAIMWGAPISLYLLAVALFPVPCMSLMYGKAIPHAAEVLRGFAFIYALMFVNALLRIELRSLERTKPVFVSYLAGLALSLALAFPFARAWGMFGAVTGLALQHVVSMFILGVCAARLQNQTKREAVCA